MTTTDRELLQRAAKAAGYTLKWGDVYMVGDDEVDCTDQPYVASGQPDEADWYWNPLHDDGDALRLAVKLGLVVDTDASRIDGRCTCVGGRDGYLAHEAHNSDPCAATRRAIVRAAAMAGEGE